MKADVHSHILPEIDDGAQDRDQSRAALQAQASLGITHLALTPHFYPSLMPLDVFLERRESAYQTLLAFPEAKHFTFSLGAEVYFTKPLLSYRDLSPLCYEGTSKMLTELETKDQFSSQMEQDLFRLIEERGITPILAHIDRYPFLINDKQLLRHLNQMGCLFQINLDAFSPYFLRKKVFGWLEENPEFFLGQDVHSLPVMGKEREKLLKKIVGRDETLIEKANESAFRHIFVATAAE